MTEIDLGAIEHGLFILFWTSGGTSLAAVGSDASGRRWYAPTNWITVPSFDWSKVAAIQQIPVLRVRQPDEKDSV
jgi:hypothetical protein